ncbi:MAG: prephenate dehydrogenase [Acholeplasmataceae bacterium]
MKKVFIVGLGLMGASYALKLKSKNYLIYGYDSNDKTNQKALKDNLIIDNDISKIKDSDIIIMCLYPKDIVKFIKKHQNLFNNNQLLTDISGTKEHLINDILEILPKKIRYLSHHPMAGRELSGYDHKDIQMFKDANFLIVETNRSNELDIKTLTNLGIDLGFKTISIIKPKEHDELIAHTSQLTHLLAVSLMLTNINENTKYATGDSFRDLTRIAKINETLWTELFLDNKITLNNISVNFINKLKYLLELINNDEKDELIKNLKLAKEKRIEFDKVKN